MFRKHNTTRVKGGLQSTQCSQPVHGMCGPLKIRAKVYGLFYSWLYRLSTPVSSESLKRYKSIALGALLHHYIFYVVYSCQECTHYKGLAVTMEIRLRNILPNILWLFKMFIFGKEWDSMETKTIFVLGIGLWSPGLNFGSNKISEFLDEPGRAEGESAPGRV